MADAEAGVSGAGEPLRGSDVVLRTGPAGAQLCSGTITFAGAPEFGKTTQVFLGPTPIEHVNLIGDTAESMAKCFALVDQCGFDGRVGAGGRRGADDHVASDGGGRQHDGHQREHEQHGVYGGR